MLYKADQHAVSHRYLMLLAVFICLLATSFQKLLHKVIRGSPILLHSGEQIVRVLHNVVGRRVEVEKVGFTTGVETVVEVVRGVVGIG